jgi:integrase/recombinase XerD
MIDVTLQPLQHRGMMQIAILFERNGKVASVVRKLPGARWSQTNKCWYLPLSKENYSTLFYALRPHCQLQTTAMQQYFNNKEQVSAATLTTAVVPSNTSPTRALQQSTTALPVSRSRIVLPAGSVTLHASNIYPVNAGVLTAMRQQLELKAYSQSTISTYLKEMSVFLQMVKGCKAGEFTTQRIKDYLQYCYTALGLSENTLHSRINALKFYYEQVLKRERFFWEIPRPKKQLVLPKVLGEEELRRLFNAITYKKHKAILFTAYSAGLRVSEVINLQLKHIDRSRMQLFIAKSKGKKDRYVGLSPVLLDILEKYYEDVQPKPVVYLFEGGQRGAKYGVRSAQKVFQIAKQKAGIHKEVGFHSLRHSFATHLLEKGIDIRYIKDILGHFNIHTTERYLHVKKEKLVNIISPLDDLWEKEELDW